MRDVLDEEENLGKSRVTKPLGDLPADLDSDIMERTKDLVVKGDGAFRGGDQASHVLLAACGDQETAREDHSGSGKRQGCFTRTFLKEVKDPSRGSITYSTLIEEFPPLTNWRK